MKIRKVSIVAVTLVSLALLLNSFLLWQLYQSHTQTVIAQKQRHLTFTIMNDLQIQIFQLNKLVNAYISTANPKYLIYYYDLLGIQEGSKVQPEKYDLSYWPSVISGEKQHKMPLNGQKNSLAMQMENAGFAQSELELLNEVLAILNELKKTEQIAFAATQGLYDVEKGAFIDDGIPDLKFAQQLIYTQHYQNTNTKLLQTIQTLITQASNRTESTVQISQNNLQNWIILSIGVILVTMIIILSSLFVVEKFLLAPIQALTFGAQMIAQKKYTFQIKIDHWLEELSILALTFNQMAQDIFSDIAYREKIQQTLNDSKKEAENATKAKSIFLATMSHEIRTPMNAIIGMSYLALQTKLEPRQKEYIDQVHIAANSLLRIINDILDFSKIEAGKMTIENIPFNVAEFLEGTIKLHEYQAEERGIELIYDTSNPLLQDDTLQLLGDKLRIGQILNNLLSNAIKFTQDGFVKFWIETQRDTKGMTVSFYVQDSGIGMSEAQLGNLFQEFTQADDSTTRKYGGTGLGLAISKNLAQQMQGTLTAQSTLGKGSTFNFTLHFDESKEKPSSQHTIAYSKSLGKTLQDMRVLLAEDNAINEKIVVELLHSKGVHVSVVHNGQEAFEKVFEVEPHHYDAVLMDLKMPVMDGYDATAAIRAKPIYDTLPIIALSAHATQEMLPKMLKIGMQGFIAKPIEPTLLFDTLLCYSKRIDILGENSKKETFSIFIEGLDTTFGLRNAAYNQNRYHHMLTDFIRDDYDAPATLKASLQDKDITTQKIRELRRTLGNIGARGLHVKLKTLKDALENPILAAQVLDDFTHEYALLQEHIKAYLETLEHTNNASLHVDTVNILKILKKKLEENDFEAIELWTEHKTSFEGQLNKKNITKITKLLTLFEFDNALKILNETHHEL